MTITGSNTTNFSFQKLGSNDDAGYSTINEVVDSIDSQLNNSDRLLKSGLTPTTGYTLKWDGSDWISGTLDSVGITNLAVTTAKINDLAVTTGKIADDAVTSAKIADGSIVNADINSSAGIVDTKLATISTAGKVANSATTASSANGNNTIVARDAGGNFSADTITASSFVGTATSASNIVGGSAASIPYQTGTSTTGMLANGTAGQVLTSNGTTVAPSWQNASIGTANIATNAITQDKMADDSVGTAEIINANVTYPKLASNAKTYSVATTATTGVYYTSSEYLTSASVSTVSSQNPLVIANHATVPILLRLPNDIGSAGATITICQLGAASVIIQPYVPGGAIPSINGSTSATYTLGGQYSIVTLVCLANTGSGSSTWVITGDYA